MDHILPQVADFAMLPPKDTRELLYRMLRAGFVFMQVRATAAVSIMLLPASCRAAGCQQHVLFSWVMHVMGSLPVRLPIRPYSLFCSIFFDV